MWETARAVAQIAGAASAPLPPEERAQSVLSELRAFVPFDHAEIATLDPFRGTPVLLANDGYDPNLLEHLHGSQFATELSLLGMRASGMPLRMRDVPGDAMEVKTIAEVLRPAGYAEGLTVCLRDRQGRETGMLNLSTGDDRHPSDEERDLIRLLVPTLANVADATQSARLLAAQLAPQACAIGLSAEGTSVLLTDGPDHALFALSSPLVAYARELARDHTQGVRFLWPATERSWYRVVVVPCSVREPSGISTVLAILDDPVCSDLTRRELQVLTMLTSGWSNAEIGNRIWISPRTVATYVERILEKLSVPTRAAAAARAVAEGLIIPLEPKSDDHKARASGQNT